MRSFLTLPAAALTVMLLAAPAAAQFVNAPADPAWTVPEIGALPDDEPAVWCAAAAISITATYAHIGPAVADESKRYAGNNLACSNCHLNAGTKKFGMPLWGL